MKFRITLAGAIMLNLIVAADLIIPRIVGSSGSRVAEEAAAASAWRAVVARHLLDNQTLPGPKDFRTAFAAELSPDSLDLLDKIEWTFPGGKPGPTSVLGRVKGPYGYLIVRMNTVDYDLTDRK